MRDRTKIVEEIIDEFTLAQSTGLQHPPAGSRTPFPPMIGTGDGTHFAATERLLACVSELASSLSNNNTLVKNGFPEAEFYTLVERSLGQSIQSLGVGGPNAISSSELLSTLETLVGEEVNRRKRSLEIFLGCTLIRGAAVYPITVGPAIFHERIAWLAAREAKNEVSKITARRIRKIWAGDQLRKRKNGRDQHNENSILRAIGNNPVVCSVTTNGLTQNNAKEKGIQCARLATTSVALMWAHPQNTLEWMHLKYDGERYLREYAVLTPGNKFISSGSSTSKLPDGIYADHSIISSLSNFQPILDILGGALSNYVDGHHSTTKPEISDAIFLSLWWYQQGCREQSDHMAVVAFAASLDALAAGGKAKGINELIEARLGISSNQKLMTDGRTAGEVIGRVYDAARSRLIHGSSVDYREDWSRLRGTAESLGRLALVQVCDWVQKHPTVKDPKALRHP